MGPFPLGGTEQSHTPPLILRGSTSNILLRMAPPKLLGVGHWAWTDG